VFNLSKIQIESNSQPGRYRTDKSQYCVQSFKDTNRKQFTTIFMFNNFIKSLCSIFQRYKSKAIHNITSSIYAFFKTVFNLSKIQIESNSQRNRKTPLGFADCVQSFKDTNRKQFTTQHDIWNPVGKLCSIFQRYKSKAIHNAQMEQQCLLITVFNLSKIQIESNSQQRFALLLLSTDCVQSFKDTNRKQFTTR